MVGGGWWLNESSRGSIYGMRNTAGRCPVRSAGRLTYHVQPAACRPCWCNEPRLSSVERPQVASIGCAAQGWATFHPVGFDTVQLFEPAAHRPVTL